MFRRRTPLTKLKKARSIIWPERGFRRLFAYLFQRVVRLPGSSASIATGLACGVAVSFTPFVGLHLLIAALFAILFRGNVLASAVGTFFGNPWTFLFIWASDYRLGLWLLQKSGDKEQYDALTIQQLTDVMALVIKFFILSPDADWSRMTLSLEQVFIPLTIGGIILAVLSWIVAFVITFYSLEAWRSHRAKRLENKAMADKSGKETF